MISGPVFKTVLEPHEDVPERMANSDMKHKKTLFLAIFTMLGGSCAALCRKGFQGSYSAA